MTAIYNKENHSLIQWIMAACWLMRPNNTDKPPIVGYEIPWKSSGIKELGMREASYEDSSESPDLVRFTCRYERLDSTVNSLPIAIGHL